MTLKQDDSLGKVQKIWISIQNIKKKSRGDQ